METEPIVLIRHHFKEAFKDIDLRNVILNLKSYLNIERLRYDELHVLEAQCTKFSIDRTYGILSKEQEGLQYRNIHHRIIQVINAIEQEDLSSPVSTRLTEEELATIFPKLYATTTNTPDYVKKKGRILYRIPEVMSKKSTKKCIVRIAFTEEDLVKPTTNKSKSAEVKDIRIANKMGVSLHSANSTSFSFTHTSQKQSIEQNSYTEWIIYATPKTKGEHRLLLQASVYETENGNEVVSKDFNVAEKKITVLKKNSEDEDDEADDIFIAKSDIEEEKEKNTTEKEKEEKEKNQSIEKYKNLKKASIKGLPTFIVAMLGMGFELSSQTFTINTPIIPPLQPSPDYDFSLDININEPPSILDKLKEAFENVLEKLPEAVAQVTGGYLLAEIIIAISSLIFQPHLNLSYNYQHYPDSLNIMVKGDRPPFRLNIKNRHQETLFDTVFSEKLISENIAYKDLITKNKDTLFFHLEDEGNTYVSFFEKHISQFEYLSQFDTLQKDTLFNPFVEISYQAVPGTDSLKLIANGSHPPFTLYLKGHRDTSFFDTLQFIRPDSQIFDFNKLRIGQGDTITFHLHDNIGLKDTMSLFSFVKINYQRKGKDALKLYITGTHPPFDLSIKREKDNLLLDNIEFQKIDSISYIFKNIQLSPKDKIKFNLKNRLNLIDSIIYVIPEEYNPPIGPIIISHTPSPVPPMILGIKGSFHQKILSILPLGGLSVDLIAIKELNTAIEIIKKGKPKKDNDNHIRINCSNIKDFKPGRTYQAEVTDYEQDATFYYKFKIKEEDHKLSVICNFNERNKELNINIKGNRPPFKVFINDVQRPNLQWSKEFLLKFENDNCNGLEQQTINLKIIDKEDKVAICTQEIGEACNIYDGELSSGEFTKCHKFEQFGNSCAILYLYREFSGDHWKMRDQTFKDCNLLCRIKSESFRFYKMDASSILPTCTNSYFTNLGDATTFIYIQTNSNIPPSIIRLDGFVSSNDLMSYINCPQEPPNPEAIDLGPSIEEIPPTTLAFSAPPDTTYKYEGGFKERNLKITPILEPKHRIQIYSLPKVKNVNGKEIDNKFHRKLTELVGLKLGYEIFIRHDIDKWYIFLGGFSNDEDTKAKRFIDQLKNDKRLDEEFLGKDDKDEKFINSIFFKYI